MSGEEVKKKLLDAGVTQAKVAELLGIIPQSLNQALNAQDVKSGLLEDISRVLGVKVSFFYGEQANGDMETLQMENASLKEELERLKAIKIPTKDSKVYNIWMKFMEITEEMQEMYNEEKKG